MIKAIRADSVEDIKVIFNSLGYKEIPVDRMLVYGYWNEDKCVGVSFLSESPPHYFTIELRNAKSMSAGQAMGHVLAESVKVRSSLLGKVAKDNFKCLKLCKHLGFRVVYTEPEYVILEFRKEFWRYGKRWTM